MDEGYGIQNFDSAIIFQNQFGNVNGSNHSNSRKVRKGVYIPVI